MATRRKDIIPGKEKKTIPSPSPIHSTKTSTSVSPNPSHPKLQRQASTDISKNIAKKPSSSQSPAPDRRNPSERKTAPPVSSITQKTTPQKTTRPSTTPIPRSSSLPVLKAAASTKPAQDKDKNVKPQVKDVGKNRLATHARPVGGTVKKVGADVKKQGAQKTTSAVHTKKQGSQNTTSTTNGRVSSTPPAHKKIGHANESEVKCHDKDVFLAEFDDPAVEDLRTHNEHEFSETFSYEQSEDEKDGQIETAEFSMVLEHQDEPIAEETEVGKDEPCIEEVRLGQHELEDAVDEVLSAGYNADRENDEEVEEGEDTVLNKKEAAASGKEAHKFHETGKQQGEEKKKDTENSAPKQQIVEEKTPSQGIAIENKQESENTAPQQEVFKFKNQKTENASRIQAFLEKKQELENASPRLQYKKGGSPVANDVIEETAIKLREQRKNKVKALAKAFESVMGLQ